MQAILNDFALFFGVTGFLNGFFLSIYLFIRRKHPLQNRIFAFLILALSCEIGFTYILTIVGEQGLLQHFAWKFAVISYMAIASLSYFYIESLRGKLTSIKKTYYFHFAPSLIILFLPHAVLISPYRFALVQAFFFGYIAYNAYFLNKAYQAAEFNAILSKKQFFWLRDLLIGLSIIWISVLTKNLIELATLYTFILYILVLVIIEKQELFTGKKTKTTEQIISSIGKNEVLDYMQKEKPYLDPELSLPRLAKHFELNRNAFSKFINDEFKQNFSEFVNYFRIEEAKKILVSPKYEDYSISRIAFDCGFNNISTFNLAFKKYTRLTPSQYVKANKPS